MAIIFETENFKVDSEDEPLIDREDGGHLVIRLKQDFRDRTCCLPRERYTWARAFYGILS